MKLSNFNIGNNCRLPGLAPALKKSFDSKTVVKSSSSKMNEVKEIFEKGLWGVKFIKTGKEVMEKLKNQNTANEIEISSLQRTNNDLKKDIGEEPTEDYDYWETDDNNDKITCKQYSMSYDDKVVAVSNSTIPILSGIDDTSNAKQTADINRKKRDFNNNCYRICRLKSKVAENKVLIRNLKSNQKIDLSSYDLKNLGF